MDSPPESEPYSMSRIIGTLPVYIVLLLLFLFVLSTCCWRNRIEIKRLLCCFRRQRSLSRVRDECDEVEAAGSKFDFGGQTQAEADGRRRSKDGDSGCDLTEYSTGTTQKQVQSSAQSIASACSFSPGAWPTVHISPLSSRQPHWQPGEPTLSEVSAPSERGGSFSTTLGGRASPLSHDQGSFRGPQWLDSHQNSSSVASFRQLNAANELLTENQTWSASVGGQLRGGTQAEGSRRSSLPGRLSPLANAPAPVERYRLGTHSASMSCMDQHLSGPVSPGPRPSGARAEAVEAKFGWRGRHSASMTSMADYAAAADQERRLGDYSPASAVAGVPVWARQGSMRVNVETGARMSPEETKARSPWGAGARRHSAHVQLGSASRLSSAKPPTPGSPGGSWRTKDERKHDIFAHTHKLVDHQTGKPREYSASFMGFKNPKPSIENLPSWASPI
jgi:hypothetical protein